MAYTKVYNRKNWAGYPAKNTPITADNLNVMDKGIDDIDDRLVEVGNKALNMESDVANVKSDVASLGDDVDDLTGQLSALNENKNGYLSNIVLKNDTSIGGGQTATFIATENCYVTVTLRNDANVGSSIFIDDVLVRNQYITSGYIEQTTLFNLKKNQTLKIENNGSRTCNYTVYKES